MALDTVFLIGILTLLSVGLGVDFLLIVAHFPSQKTAEEAFDVFIGSLYSHILISLSAVFSLALVCAIALNYLPDKSRTEPYLLKIGLGALIAYGVIFGLNFLLFGHDFPLLMQFVSTIHAFFPKGTTDLLLWFRLPIILICYWAFLHYALNPRV